MTNTVSICLCGWLFSYESRGNGRVSQKFVWKFYLPQARSLTAELRPLHTNKCATAHDQNSSTASGSLGQPERWSAVGVCYRWINLAERQGGKRACFELLLAGAITKSAHPSWQCNQIPFLKLLNWTSGTDGTCTDIDDSGIMVLDHDIGTILSHFHWWILRLSAISEKKDRPTHLVNNIGLRDASTSKE